MKTLIDKLADRFSDGRVPPPLWPKTDKTAPDREQETVAQPEQAAAVTAELQNDLAEITASLTHFVDGSEADFMLLGIGLRTVHSNVKELTELMLDSVGQIGGGEQNGFLDRGRDILNDSLAEIQAYQDQVKVDLKRIDTVVDNLENLHGTSKQIKQFAKSLKTVALTMLVENARTIGSKMDIFSEVAQEVKALSVEIATIANDVSKKVEKARFVHLGTREEIIAGLSDLEALTSEIRTTVRDSTRDTETLMLFSVDIIEKAGRRSRDISRQVAEVVMGVQFHDNMKQRIMHLIGLIEAMAETAKPITSSFADEPPREGIPLVPKLNEEAHRLEDINDEIENVYYKNKQALQAIKNEVTEMLRELKEMSLDMEEDGYGSQVSDPFAHLKKALTQLHNLLDEGKTLYSRIRKAADQVSDIAVNLSELLHIVRGISAHTHNKAINSIIAADRQGRKGGAMKMLAREMNELATQSDKLSGEVEENITTIINLTGDIGQGDFRGLSERDNDISAIDRLNGVLEDISRGYENFRKSSLFAYQRVGELGKAVDTTLVSLDFFAGLSGQLKEYRNSLVDIAEQPGRDLICVDIDQATANHLPGKHNLKNEDNVMLFDDTRKSGSNDSSDPSLGDNVELF